MAEKTHFLLFGKVYLMVTWMVIFYFIDDFKLRNRFFFCVTMKKVEWNNGRQYHNHQQPGANPGFQIDGYIIWSDHVSKKYGTKVSNNSYLVYNSEIQWSHYFMIILLRLLNCNFKLVFLKNIGDISRTVRDAQMLYAMRMESQPHIRHIWLFLPTAQN